MTEYLLMCHIKITSTWSLLVGFIRAAKWQLLIWIAVALASSASASELLGPRLINTGAGRILSQSGIGNDLPEKITAPPEVMLSVERSMGASPVKGDATQVSGLIVRFSSLDVKRLSRENLPPPQALIEEISRLAGTPLIFRRAMSLESFIFRFSAPMSWADAQDIVNRVKQSPNIERVEPDAQATHSLVPNDPYLSYQWSLRDTATFPGSANTFPAWDITQGSSATIVAVVDTGVRPHTEFYSRLLPGYDFVSDLPSANDGDGRDADAYDPGDWVLAEECGKGAPQEDSSWHGTHVSGVIAATGNNSSSIAGINWLTRILPVRVLGKCGGTTSDIIDGMLWAAGIAVPGVPSNPNPAKIINMSLGGSSPGGCSATSYPDAINQIKAKGVLIVVAAGNSDAEAATFVPASCDGIMTVGAVGPEGYRASYSNYSQQNKVTISAPGGDMSSYGNSGGIYSTVNTGKTVPEYSGYAYMQGTSQATPHVAGVASLALALDPQISPEMLQISLILSSRSFPSGSQCTKYYPLCGVGIIDAYNTLLAVNALKPYSLVYEYYNVDLKHYFRTSTPSESSFVLTGGAGASWRDTQDYFLAWRDDSQGAVPVCRFYGTPGKGPNSHFYTADAGECAFVKKDPGWTYEGIAYYIKLPVNGACASGTIPIYRVYNNRWMYNDSNHRFTTDTAVVADLVTNNWVAEGMVMCAAGG